MSEQTENKLLILAAFLLYGLVGGMEMQEQIELEQTQYATNKPKPKPKPADTTPEKCKIRTKTDSCIVRLA